MSDSIKFNELRDQIPAEKVIEYLGLTLTAATVEKKADDGTILRDVSFRGRCPTCGDPRAFSISQGKRRFNCFKCKKLPDEKYVGGDFLKLVSKVKGLSTREAAEELQKLVETKPAAPKKSEGFDAQKYLESLDLTNEGLEPFGLSPETLKEWKGGWKRGKLMVAIEASDGIKGFLGIDPELQMSFPKEADGKPFEPRNYIFGLYHLQMGEVRVLRTPLEVLQASEQGVSNCVSFFTENVSTDQLLFLHKYMESRGLTHIAL